MTKDAYYMASSDRSGHIIYHPDSSERKCARSIAQLHKMAKDVRLALVSKKNWDLLMEQSQY